jgi:hypothetical protein
MQAAHGPHNTNWQLAATLLQLAQKGLRMTRCMPVAPEWSMHNARTQYSSTRACLHTFVQRPYFFMAMVILGAAFAPSSEDAAVVLICDKVRLACMLM